VTFFKNIKKLFIAAAQPFKQAAIMPFEVAV
jgi:hypothetical protein